MHVAVGQGFEHLGFSPEFEVEVTPEFPATGSWPYPAHSFDLEGRVVGDPVSRWGAPVVVVVKPVGGAPWVGLFPSSSRGRGLSCTIATPNPRKLCVAVKGATYIVDVDRPREGAVAGWAEQLVGIGSPALLLAVSAQDVVAYGADGFEWRSPRLAIDGLRVIAVREGRISVSDLEGDGQGAEVVIEVDALTGRPMRRRF